MYGYKCYERVWRYRYLCLFQRKKSVWKYNYFIVILISRFPWLMTALLPILCSNEFVSIEKLVLCKIIDVVIQQTVHRCAWKMRWERNMRYVGILTYQNCTTIMICVGITLPYVIRTFQPGRQSLTEILGKYIQNASFLISPL